MTESNRSQPWIVVANEKGGVGKSTLALAIADRFFLYGRSACVVQIDRQQRLSKALAGKVVTIASDPKAARASPELETKRFSPLLSAVESAAGTTPVLIDVGAGETGRFAEWAALVDLEEDLTVWKFAPVVFVPYLAEAEAIRQAAWSVERLVSVLPGARVVLVENQRDGRVDDLHPASAAAEALRVHLGKVNSDALNLCIGAIPSNSWRHFEAAGCRFVDVVDLSTESAMALTGLPRAEAKIARGDVAQWLVRVFEVLDRILDAEVR